MICGPFIPPNLIFSVDIANPKSYTIGGSEWTPIMRNVTQGPNYQFTKTGGSGWDNQFYSAEGYTTNVYLSANPISFTDYSVIGFNSDPTTPRSNYETIDYCFWLAGSEVRAMENGVFQSTSYYLTNNNDTLYLSYDGSVVRYFINSTQIRSVSRSVGAALYVDSSIRDLGDGFRNVSFGTIGEQGVTKFKDMISGSTSRYEGGNPSYSTDNRGKLIFTQSTGLINSTQLATLDNELTIEAFVKFNNSFNSRHVILSNATASVSQTKGFSFFWDRFTYDGLMENSLRFKFGQNSTTWNHYATKKGTLSRTDSFYQVVVTATGLNSSNPDVKFYLNSEQLSATFSNVGSKAAYLTASSTFRIASEFLSTTQSFTASIETSIIRAYSRAITPLEVSKSWKSFKGRFRKDKMYLAGGNFTSWTNMINSDNYSRYILKYDLDGYVSQRAEQGFNGNVSAFVKTNDNKILIFGSFTEYAGQSYNRIVRLNSDLSIDNTFNPGTGFNNTVWGAKVDSDDGSIYVAGAFTQYNGTTANRIVKLSNTGTLSGTFSTGTGFNNDTYDIELDSNKNVIVTGIFTDYNGTAVGRIVRILPSGSIDTSFTNQTTGFNSDPRGLKIDSNGRIWIVGNFTSYAGSTYNRFVVLNSDSTVWTGITYSTGFNAIVYDIIPISNGGWLVVGNFTLYKGVTNTRIIKLNSIGEADTSFSAGTGFDTAPWHASELPDGRIAATGFFTSYNGTTSYRVVLLNSNGSISMAFSSNDLNSYPRTVHLIGNELVVAGFFNLIIRRIFSKNRILKFNFNYIEDTTFQVGQGFNNYIQNIMQHGENYLISGWFSSYNSLPSTGMELLRPNGSRVSSFNLGNGFQFGAGPQIYAMDIDTSGNILATGRYTAFNDKPSPTFIIVNQNGQKITPDIVSFPGYGANNSGQALKIDYLGRIYFGGLFTAYGTYSVTRIARLNPDSLTVDTTFNTGTGLVIATSLIGRLDVDRNNKLYVTGDFTSYNGTSISRILRLNTDGSLDNTFSVGTGFDAASRGCLVLDDGKIVVWGAFRTYNGTTANGIIRLNTDGSIDNSFNTGLGLVGTAYDCCQDGDQIIVSGTLTAYNNTPIANIVRINYDGSIDTTFNIGFNELVWSVKVV